MKTSLKSTVLLGLLLLPESSKAQKKEDEEFSYLRSTAQACNENGMVAAWCDTSISEVECFINPDTSVYACMCTDPAACPEECIVTSDENELMPPPLKSSNGIICHSIPTDEPNYVLKSDVSLIPSLHHCENNALVASWCNEATVPDVSCLVLPSLDEYVCTCTENSAACPSECIGGEAPDRKTHNAVRCRGLPVDSPNYVLE